MPAFRIRATAPPHSSMSGFIGFLISTVTSEPFSASAISCTLNGLTVVRAPTQITSTPNSSAASTCLDVATSVPIGKPVISRARLIHASPLRPTPSNEPGFVRGFQMPALSTSTRPGAGNPPAGFQCLFLGFRAARARDNERAFRLDVKRFHIVVLFALFLICLAGARTKREGLAPPRSDPDRRLSFRSGPGRRRPASPLGTPGPAISISS